MKKIVLAFLSVLITNFSFAQYWPETFGLCSYRNSALCYTAFNIEDKDIVYVNEGTPYENEKYVEGAIVVKGEKSFTAPMRYNANKDVIEFLDEKSIVKEILRRPYITASFNGKTYRIFNYMDDNGAQKLGYFNPLKSGDTKLLYMPKKDQNIGKHKYVFNYGSSVLTIPVIYKDISSHYIKKRGNPAENIKLNKTNVLHYLEDRSVELTLFISENHLNLKKEKDVLRLLEYYDSLKNSETIEKPVQS